MPENHGGKIRSVRRQKSGLKAKVDIFFLSSILTWCILDKDRDLSVQSKFLGGGGAELVDGGMK